MGKRCNIHLLNKRCIIHVIPNASQEKMVEQDGRYRVYLKASPEKGKANKALVKFLKKEHGLSVWIVSGERSRDKVIEISG